MTYTPDPQDADRIERVETYQTPNTVEQRRVVVDTAAERSVLLHRLSQFVWLLSGILLALLGLRFVLKLIAANSASPFAGLVYGITDLFLWPFYGLTAQPSAGGFVLEIPTLIAMAVYALLTWLVVKLLWVLFAPANTRSVSTYRQDVE